MAPAPAPEKTSRRAVIDAARSAFTKEVLRHERFFGFALAFVAVLGAFLLARKGTLGARFAAGAIMVSALALAFLFASWRSRTHRGDIQILDRLFARIDEERAARARRAVRMRDVEDGSSPALRALHLERTFFALPLARLFEDLTRRGRRVRVAATVTVVFATVLSFAFAFRLYEGVDVFFAREGRAPLSATWIDSVTLRARPPAYLRLPEIAPDPRSDVALPVGTVVTVRAKAVHSGRDVFLSGGPEPVPFVSDGAGGLVAIFTLLESTELRAAARFGDVTIYEPDALAMTAIPDAAPVVTLEGAPRTIDLTTTTESTLDLKFSVRDDHGLREIALVLRSGNRTDRRTIQRLDGETKTHEAGIRLRLGDPFVEKSHLPVEVTIEAKDNDPITGPKWGKSAAIELRTPKIGEAERDRLLAFRAARDAYIDALALLLGPIPANAEEGKRAKANEATVFDDAKKKLEDAIAFERAGRKLPARLRSVLRGRLAKFEAVEKDYRAGRSRDKFTVATEKLVLYLDGVLRGQGYREARKVALELGDVAELVEKPLMDERGELSAESQALYFSLLDEGGTAMLSFGTLGHDIGEIVLAYTPRIRRGLAEQDRPHAALAALDLMLRLRTPDPSFRAEGSGGGYGGSESGSSGGGGGAGQEGESQGEGDASEGDRAFEEGAHDLDDLVKKHGEAIDKAEQAASGEGTPDEKRERGDEARRHADNVRRGVEPLSKGEPDEKQAKEGGEGMAGALERRDLQEATKRGRDALKKLESLREGKDAATKKRLDEAKNRIEEEVAWAEGESKKEDGAKSKGKGERLREVGEEEKRLGEKAREFAESGEEEKAEKPLREATKRAEAAAEAFQKGDAPKGLAEQREAQRQLEAAREAMQREQSSNSENGRDISTEKTKIPTGDEHKGPEEWRGRVLKGLAQPHGPKYGDAVRRYAEELLR